MAKPPDSLDPAVGDTPEALEADWLAYTPLLTYAHSNGADGTRVTPGLAATLPWVTSGGRAYTFTLRPGLKYSDGQPVRASDFTWAVKRAIKLWRGAGVILNHIAGAKAFAAGRAKTISGITANDATGEITIRLTAPDGTFENVLCFPALAPVPAGTPMTEQTLPPPGLGPYRIKSVVPGKSFALVRNPGWKRLGILLVPAGHLDIDVRITGDARHDAISVLDNTADVFDWRDQIPSSLLGQIKRRASRRYFRRAMYGTRLIFLNATRKPFSSQLAREAVRAGLDQGAVSQVDAGMLMNGCYVLPPTLWGHPGDACPDGNKAGDGNLPMARALVKRSGMAGTRVVVWSEASSTIRRWMAYYTSLLNQIGFKASLKTVADTAYFSTIGDVGRDPQTGYGEFAQDLPNPVDIYRQLTGRAIRRAANRNWSQVDDPYVNRTVRVLGAVPASSVEAVAKFWRQLELYVAEKAYFAVLGYPTVPEFVSSRIDFRDLIFSPVAGDDWSSIRLK
jgi:peptide/nickel transport system substrate-binding protein